MTCRGATWLLLLSAVSGFALQPPLVNSAASTGVGLAPGSMVDLYIFDGPTISATSPVTLRVQPEGSTQVFTCPILSSWVYGVRAILPLGLSAGAANITLAVNGEAYPSTAVTLVPAAPALFSVNQFMGGWGALAQNLDSLGAPSLNRLTNPALPGQYVTLWGSGLGNLTTGDVSVDLAGERIPAYFAGHSPGIPGMDQISFRIPAGAYDGCYVPVVLRAAGVASNSVTTCQSFRSGSLRPSSGAFRQPNEDAGRWRRVGVWLSFYRRRRFGSLRPRSQGLLSV